MVFHLQPMIVRSGTRSTKGGNETFGFGDSPLDTDRAVKLFQFFFYELDNGSGSRRYALAQRSPLKLRRCRRRFYKCHNQIANKDSALFTDPGSGLLDFGFHGLSIVGDGRLELSFEARLLVVRFFQFQLRSKNGIYWSAMLHLLNTVWKK